MLRALVPNSILRWYLCSKHQRCARNFTQGILATRPYGVRRMRPDQTVLPFRPPTGPQNQVLSCFGMRRWLGMGLEGAEQPLIKVALFGGLEAMRFRVKFGSSPSPTGRS